MSTASSELQRDARLQLVAEHLRAENEHDVDAIMATFGENPSFQLNAVHLEGSDNIRGMYRAFGFGENGGFSDIKAELLKQHVTDDTIITELTLKAKHTGDWQGIPPTNREFEVPLIAIFEFDATGKLAGERVYFDGALMLQQLGLLPS
jgi:steroid delta-isomerase-like uncharacterized protein